MRKINLTLLVLLFLCYSSHLLAQSCEKEGTTVSIILEREKELIPDILLLNFKASIFTQKEVEAINGLGDIDKALRQLNLEYKGGRYTIYQNCWWEGDKRKCSGYIGSISYTFLLNNYSDQNRIFDVMDKFKEKYGEKVKFEIQEPEWSISKKRRKVTEEELRLLIVESAKDFSKMISKSLEKSCEIVNIDFTTISIPVYRPFYLKTTETIEKRAIDAPEPKRDEQSVGIKASVKLRCK